MTRRARAAFLPLALACATIAPPVVDRLEPCGGQRGTTVEVTFRGQRLAGALGVLSERTGLEVVQVAAGKEDACKVTLRIAADCPLGAHPLRLHSERGLANPRTFHVGTLVEVAEARQGDGAQVVALNSTVNGNLRGEELDRYRVAVPAGARVRCEVEAMRLGVAPLDLALSVRGPASKEPAGGREVAQADDTAHGHKDPWVAFDAAAAGDYELTVRRAFADDQNQGAYRLHVGTFPRPTLTLPCGGAPGAALPVRGLGDGEPLPFTAELRDDGDGFARCFPSGANGTAPTPVLLRAGGPPETAAPPDDKGRVWLPVPGATSGVVAQADAPARLWFAAKKGADLDVRVLANALGSTLDPALTLKRADGRFVAFDDDGGGVADAYLRFQVPDDGEWQLEILPLCQPPQPLMRVGDEAIEAGGNVADDSSHSRSPGLGWQNI